MSDDAAARWQRVKTLFAASLERPVSERDAWLAQTCGADETLRAELESLLAQQRTPSPLFAGELQALLGRLMPPAAPDDAHLGGRIGNYRLARELGVGGMGRVYLAERADGEFMQRVALKLVRSEFATPELLQRFRRERDTLARLNHPNIAALHDGGVGADGAPYFTLEYIEGEPITRWCDEHRCTLAARVKLLLKVCDAVQHAHRNLIVHRDLKPSNILVTAEGEPKLLDFGIAKPLEPGAGDTLTNADARPMTREYAAPEQVLGEPVTTGTDVYALGVLLYLLVCGQLPYRRAALGEASWLKAIVDEAPEPLAAALCRVPDDTAAIAVARGTTPPALARSLRGDLDRIVQRALEKTPEARYPAASALAGDLGAWLDGRALSGGTRRYRVRKFVRRHWLPLAAGALVFLIVLAAAIGLAWEAAQVERQARTTAAVKDFLIDLLQKANPEIANGKVPTVRDAVDQGVKRLDAIPASEPALRAELEVTLGTIYYQLGLQQQARDMHHDAFAVLKDRASDALLAVRAERFEAVETGGLGDFAAAQTLADDAYARLSRVSNAPLAERVRTLDTLNYVAVHRSDLARQKTLSAEAVAAIEGADVDDEVRAMALAMKGDYLRRAHDDAHAVEYYARLWPLTLSPQTRSAYGLGYGSSLQNLGRYAEAARYLGQAWDSTRQAYGESSTRTLRIGQMLAIDEAYAGDLKQAQAHMATLLDSSRLQSPPHLDVIAEIELNLGEMLTALQRYDEAAGHVRAALAFCAQHPNGDQQLHVEAQAALGTIELRRGRHEAAADAFTASLDLAAAHAIADVDATRAALALARAQGGDIAGALDLGAKARAGVLASQGEKSLDAAQVHDLYGRTLALAGREAEAAAEYRAAIASHALLLPPDGMHFYSADARFALGMLLLADPATRAQSRDLLAQAAALRAATLGADHPQTLAAKAELTKLAAQP